MTHSILRLGPGASLAPILIFVLAGCHGSASSPAPADFNRSPFRQAAETVALAPADQEAVYLTVLKFYRPAGDQVRLINQRLLPLSAGDSATMLDAALALRLVQALGPSRFCLQDSDAPCAGHAGGRLSVSRVYSLNSERARVVVLFEGYGGSYAPGTAFRGTEVFLVERRPDWKIVTHAPAL